MDSSARTRCCLLRCWSVLSHCCCACACAPLPLSPLVQCSTTPAAAAASLCSALLLFVWATAAVCLCLALLFYEIFTNNSLQFLFFLPGSRILFLFYSRLFFIQCGRQTTTTASHRVSVLDWMDGCVVVQVQWVQRPRTEGAPLSLSVNCAAKWITVANFAGIAPEVKVCFPRILQQYSSV